MRAAPGVAAGGGRHRRAQGRLALTFFNQPWRARELTPGTAALFSGEVKASAARCSWPTPTACCSRAGLDERSESLDAFAGALIPVYPATGAHAVLEGVPAVDLVLPFAAELADTAPGGGAGRARGCWPLAEALARIHRPADREELDRARPRLRYDEALMLQLVLARRRAAAARLPGRPCGPAPRRGCSPPSTPPCRSP